MTRITIAEASKMLSMTPLAVRYLMESGELPIGYCMRRKGSKRATYYVYLEKVLEITGSLNESGRNTDGLSPSDC